MPCFQRVHRLRLACRLASRLITRRRVFFIFAHTAKNRRIPPPSSSEDMLGGNYLIAQQLPASSPFSQAITVYIICQINARPFLKYFSTFLPARISICKACAACIPYTRPGVCFVPDDIVCRVVIAARSRLDIVMQARKGREDKILFSTL